jgi:hypothetical protein
MRWPIVLTVEDREGRCGVTVVGTHTETAVVEAEDVTGALRQVVVPYDTVEMIVKQTCDAETTPNWQTDGPVALSSDGSRIEHRGE